MDLDYIYTDGRNEDFKMLCRELDNYLNKIAGGEESRKEYIKYNYLYEIKNVIVIYQNEEAIGCASFRHYKDKVAELKRVFIKKKYRGKGYSKILMNLIEKYAVDEGYEKLILETGAPLIEAMSLYAKIGYKTIENYEPYENIKESICMEKNIL